MLKIGPSQEGEHVRDCMTWHYGYSAKGYRETPQPAPPSVGHDRNQDVFCFGRGDTPTMAQTSQPLATSYREEGTVLEALRGWPRDRNRNPNPLDCCSPDDVKQSTGPVSDPSKDPYMVDLIAHSYMYPPKSAGKDGKGGSATKKACDKSGGKPTRTSQLRHIVNAEKVNPSQKELWKMPKFTKSAKPAISTFRTPSGKKKAGAIGAKENDCTGAGAPCTCAVDNFNYTRYNPEGEYGDHTYSPSPGPADRPKYTDPNDIPVYNTGDLAGPQGPGAAGTQNQGHDYFEVAF